MFDRKAYMAEYIRSYYKKNKQAILLKTNAYKQANKDAISKVNKEYSAKNKDRITSYSKQYYINNLDTRHAYNKDYYAKNSDTVKQRSKQWVNDHLDYKKQYDKVYYINHIDNIKKYRQSEKGRSVWARSSHKRRAIQQFTDITSDWLMQLRIKSTTCPLCNEPMNDIMYDPKQKNLDHIIPLNPKCGGLHIMSNVRYICRQCNLERPKNGSDVIVNERVAIFR